MRNPIFLFLSISILGCLIFSQSSCDKKVGSLPKITPPPVNICDSATYKLRIKKIIETSCAITDCHVSGFPNGDFETFEGLKAKVNGGSFKERVFNKPDRPMPPLDNGGMLPPDKLKLIECWLDKGANND